MTNQVEIYPFAAIVGQEALKRALTLSIIDPSLGGVLALGDRGTGKTTAVRGLAAIMPEIEVSNGCRYRCDPASETALCESCAAVKQAGAITSAAAPVPVVNLPLGATEDRILGALDIERALIDGKKVFEPGLLADANRGFLYIDEVNLLEDHLVDVLLDVAASGWNAVEREGMSIRHPARFVLVGSGNPEEGELRPQLLDRFGLAVDVSTSTDIQERVEVIRRRDAYERDPVAFHKQWAAEGEALCDRVSMAKQKIGDVAVNEPELMLIAEICIALGTDGLRGELTLIKAARALAAWQGAEEVSADHIREMAASALAHRLRRDPLDDTGGTVRVERVLNDVLPTRSAA